MNYDEALEKITNILETQLEHNKELANSVLNLITILDKRVTRIEQVLNETTIVLKDIPKPALKEILKDYERR